MITPEEIQNQQFEVGFRGYNTREVDEFLNRVRSDVAEMLEERETLRKRISAAELLAKDAKDHEEDFVASIQADKDSAIEVLESAKSEGERIIREAKNAAAGIMAEVRRRAGELTAESRKASGEIENQSKAEAERILAQADAAAKEKLAAANDEAEQIIAEARNNADRVVAEASDSAQKTADDAKAAADQKLYAARTEAENIVAAAKVKADADIREANEYAAKAKSDADSVIAAAMENAELANAGIRRDSEAMLAYVSELRSEADAICRELDAELRDSAEKIALLGRKINEKEFSAPPIADPNKNPPAFAVDTGTESADADFAGTEPASADEPADAAPAPSDDDTYEEYEPADASADEETPDASDTQTSDSLNETLAAFLKGGEGGDGGYFTKEYRQVMEELFGEKAEDSGTSADDGDDDTYDYTDREDNAEKASDKDSDDSGATGNSGAAGNSGATENGGADADGGSDGDENITDTDTVTSEYGEISADKGGDTDPIMDSVYRKPTADDIKDIMNGI